MVNKDEVVRLVKQRLNHVLSFSELAVSKEQFPTYRKLVLDEFGKGGLEGDLERLYESRSRRER